MSRIRRIVHEVWGRGRKRGGAFMAAGALAWALFAGSPAAGQGNDDGLLNKKNQIKQLEFEKAQVQRRLHDFHLTESDTLEEIEALSEQIREVKWRERHLMSRRDNLLRNSRRQTARIRALTKRTNDSRARVGRHLRRLYRLSKIGDSATLIALARHKDFFKDVHYLSLIMQSDRGEIERFQQLNKKLSGEQKKVRDTLTRLASLEEELKQEQTELEQGQTRLNDSLREMRRNQNLYKKYIAELDGLREGMETAIARMERSNEINTRLTSVEDPKALRGSLPPPAPGSIIAGFGQRDPRYDLKKFQRGIVIRVNEAAPVSSIAPGRVVHAGPFRGYQQLVVVDHGKSLFSVYGHMDRLAVERGNTVQAGMRLGNATYQPIGKSYDVYFEIRWNGKAVDPLKWLKPDSYKFASANGRKP